MGPAGLYNVGVGKCSGLDLLSRVDPTELLVGAPLLNLCQWVVPGLTVCSAVPPSRG